MIKLNLHLLFEKVSCPKCRTKQPPLRLVSLLSASSQNAFTCKKCGTIMDENGNEYAVNRVKK